MNILVVIDMQPEFDAVEFIADRVIDLIEVRRAAGWQVMVLEYEGFGPTIKEIKGDFHGVKSEDSGAEVIERMITDLDLRPRHIELCGVNRFACVEDTHHDLQELGYYSYINEDACADENIILGENWTYTNRYGYRIQYTNGRCTRSIPFSKRLKKYVRGKFNRLCRILRFK